MDEGAGTGRTSSGIAALDTEPGEPAVEAPAIEESDASTGPPRSSTAPDRFRRIAYLVLLGSILLVAFAVRVPPLTSAFPYQSYIDEGHVVNSSSLLIADATFDPEFYSYPSLLINATAATAVGYAALTGSLGDLRTEAQEASATSYYDTEHPPSLLMAGRLLVLLSAIATVLLTIALGTRVGGRLTGLAAGGFVALLPALVSRSAFVITDTPVALFVVASILASTFIQKSARALVWAASAGALTGMAATTKYPSGAVILAVLAFIAMDRSVDVRRKIMHAAAALAAAGVAAAMAMPSLWLRTDAVREELSALQDRYAGKDTPLTYWSASITSAEVGWVVLVLGLLGLAVALRSGRNRPFALAILAFAVPFVASAARYDFQPFRNLLPLLPLLCVFAALALTSASRALVSRVRWGEPARVALVALPVLVIALLMYRDGVSPYLDRQTGIVDRRTTAADWLEHHTSADDSILVAEQIAFQKRDLERIPASVTVASVTEDLPDADAHDFDLLVLGSFNEEIADWAHHPDAEPVVDFAGRKVSVLPNAWRRTNQAITIYPGRVTRDAVEGEHRAAETGG